MLNEERYHKRFSQKAYLFVLKYLGSRNANNLEKRNIVTAFYMNLPHASFYPNYKGNSFYLLFIVLFSLYSFKSIYKQLTDHLLFNLGKTHYQNFITDFFLLFPNFITDVLLNKIDSICTNLNGKPFFYWFSYFMVK